MKLNDENRCKEEEENELIRKVDALAIRKEKETLDTVWQQKDVGEQKLKATEDKRTLDEQQHKGKESTILIHQEDNTKHNEGAPKELPRQANNFADQKGIEVDNIVCRKKGVKEQQRKDVEQERTEKAQKCTGVEADEQKQKEGISILKVAEQEQQRNSAKLEVFKQKVSEETRFEKKKKETKQLQIHREINYASTVEAN